jgi:hypothetical protein
LCCGGDDNEEGIKGNEENELGPERKAGMSVVNVNVNRNRDLGCTGGIRSV